MKLIRYGEPNQERPGLLDNFGKLRDLSQIIPDLAGEYLQPDSIQRLRELDVSGLPEVNGNPRIGPCVNQIGKFICIGLNFSDHAAEEEALERVAGYCVVHDVSERAFQSERSGQWVKGKSCDTFGPIGPWLVTTDEISDPQNLGLWLEVDGYRYQDGTTSTMVYGVAHLVAYLSQFFTLGPGDVISTGTPPGVGMGVKPNPVYLRPGQEVRLGVDGLGEQRQITVADE